VDFTRRAAVPGGSPAPEWTFVDPASGTEAAGGFSPYAEKSEFASPSFYGQAAALDSTLLAWVDVTGLAPFIQATHFSPNALPVRQGRSFGSNFGASELGRLPLNASLPIYDGYLYLAPGTPPDEPAMFLRYLQQVADIYDVIGRPADALPDWQDLARHSLTDLQDPDTWVTLKEWHAMADYTLVNIKQIDDMAKRFGMPPGIESRFARQPLALENAGLSHYTLGPSFRLPFGHSHSEQEEVYLVLSGSARVKLDDEVLELGQWDAVRIPVGTMRSFEGGPDGGELLAFGAPNTENKDIEMVQGWWKD
jgi:mannose-6-phosphate isomerase-like protein (cupin superfamily)